MSGLKKEYSNGEITIVWQPALCIHCGDCAQGLPKVFQPRERPWIKIDQATTAELKGQVDKCPSDALSYYMNNKETNMENSETAHLNVDVIANGPLLVRGTICIKHKDGTEEIKENKCSLCRCGASSNKPFCDGSHKTISFDQ
jgi:uncharacterized Fe-S cluster protein YjdI